MHIRCAFRDTCCRDTSNMLPWCKRGLKAVRRKGWGLWCNIDTEQRSVSLRQLKISKFKNNNVNNSTSYTFQINTFSASLYRTFAFNMLLVAGQRDAWCKRVFTVACQGRPNTAKKLSTSCHRRRAQRQLRGLRRRRR